MLSLRVALWTAGMGLAGAVLGAVAGTGMIANLDYILPCAVLGCAVGFLLGMILDAFVYKK